MNHRGQEVINFLSMYFRLQQPIFTCAVELTDICRLWDVPYKRRCTQNRVARGTSS